MASKKKEANVKPLSIMSRNILIAVVALFCVAFISQGTTAQTKVAYINSQRILENLKEAQDVQKQLNAKNQEWQQEAQKMQQQIKDLNDQLESQSLLLSQEKKDEKTREIQELYTKFQQFQQDKWGQNGEAFKLQEQLMQPIFDKIDEVLKNIGAAENYDYIFDGVGGSIVYASPDQTDLTERVLEELNKGVGSAGEKKEQ